jgi:hypothetical protein
MIQFIKPKNLDGAKLIDELLAAGVSIIGTDDVGHLGKTPPMIDGEGNLLLSIAETDKAKATAVVAAHDSGNE